MNYILPVAATMLPFQAISDNSFLQEFHSQGLDAVFQSCMCEQTVQSASRHP